MQYQSCRWYDMYPRLAFVLKLIRLMPLEKQSLMGNRLNQYLAYRMVTGVTAPQPLIKGNRWYDTVDTLCESLERLKAAPQPLKQQSTDFLVRLLEEADNRQHCA